MSEYADNNGSMDEHANEGREPRTTEELLSFYLFDELSAEKRAEVEQALQQDAGLAARLEELKETLSLLHRSAFDTENGELASERRDALREAAASAVAGKQGSASGSSSSGQKGKLLYFPTLKMAATVALIAAGVLMVNEWQKPMVADYSAEAVENESMRILIDSGYVDESYAETTSESKAKPKDSSVIEMQAGAPIEEVAETVDALRLSGYLGKEKNKAAEITSDEFAKLEALGYTGSNTLNEALRAKTQPSVGLVVADAPLAEGGYKGPGDAVPPGLAAPGESDILAGISGGSSMPSTPATPGSPSTPAPTTTPKFQFDEKGWDKIAYRKPAAGGEPSGDPDLSADSAFDSEAWNNAVGVGGGAGGKYGERSGRDGGKKDASNGEVPSRKRAEELDRRMAELQDLDDLGYIDADGKAIAGGVELTLSYGLDADFTAGENFGRYYLDETGQWSVDHAGNQPRVIVCDGYGRYYRDVHVVEHLRPIEVNETARDMFFRYYGDNPFVKNAQDNLSTFAIDVDTASYPMARKYLRDGKLPPRAAIRSEEFLNYFDHKLAAPTEGDFAVHLQAAPTPFTEGKNNILLKVGVKGREVDSAERKPLNLVFVIDKSGSMKENNRMELVKRSLELLVDQLREDDQVGIVSFDSSGHIVMESTKGAERWKLREALRQMDPGGSTNAAEGMYLGYEMLSRNYLEGATNRVILASDGVANTGETDQQRILDRIADFTSRQVDLTTIGVGMNNHNDVFLEQMANKGDGSCHYVDDFDEAKHVFIERFSGTMQTIARDVKIQVEFDEAQVLGWRQIGYENRSLQDHQFRDDRVDAGEVGAGHEIVALYEVQLKDEWKASAEGRLATVRLRWKPDGAERSSETGVVPAVEQPFAIDMNQIQPKWQETEAHFRLAAVTAQYAEFMRRSYHVRGDNYTVLQAAANRLASELHGDQKVAELGKLITETRRLVQFQPPTDELWQLIEQSRRLTLLHQELHQLEQRNQETAELMAELQAQNAELEQRIRQHLEGRN